jgi:hypothetical protein
MICQNSKLAECKVDKMSQRQKRTNLGHDGSSLVAIGGQEALLRVGPADSRRPPGPDVPADLAEDGQVATEPRFPDVRDGASPAFEGRVQLVQHRGARLGANVIKLFITVIYCRSMVIPSVCVIKATLPW